MAKLSFDEEYDLAVRAAAQADATEPRAKSARYDRRARRIVVELCNGATFIFPTELVEGLAGATATVLSEVIVTPSGGGLRWPQLDADFSLPALMRGVFGSRKWMRMLASKRKGTQPKLSTVAASASGKRRSATI